MKIVVNTIASYSRTIFGIIFVLFSSRWVLSSLGVSDFGIYSLVGSILAIVVFLNTILANGNSRFISIAIGKNDEKELNELFKTIVVIHTVVPVFVLLIGYFVGVYAINHWLEIPQQRIGATVFVFQIAIIASFFAMIAVPYTASFIANQNIVQYSLITLGQSFLYFLSAYLLRFFDGDHLIIYTIFMSVSNLLIYSIMIVVAMTKYSYCRKFWKYRFDAARAIEIVKYAFWNFIGSFGHLCRTQGVSIIVNLFFGTQGNAALGIANQVATQSANLTNALSSATSPEVYTRIGKNDFVSANNLSISISKFGTCLILLLSSVIICNLEELLFLWLTNVPPYTKELCLCFILMYILEKITMGPNIYLSGINKIALVQTLTLICYLLSIVFPYLGLINLFGIVGVGIACVLSMFLAIISVQYCYNKYSGFTSLKVFLKLIFVSFPLYGLSLLLGNINEKLLFPFGIKLVVSSLFVIIIIAFVFRSVVFNEQELKVIKQNFNKLCKKK